MVAEKYFGQLERRAKEAKQRSVLKKKPVIVPMTVITRMMCLRVGITTITMVIKTRRKKIAMMMIMTEAMETSPTTRRDF